MLFPYVSIAVLCLDELSCCAKVCIMLRNIRCFCYRNSVCFIENCKKIVQEAITDELQKMANGPNELVMNRSIELLGILKS